ncbi:hypothetical protein [Flagellimonas beolgyonensis]|uniref:hypothetical protein n=1 Tax=Flagellimonas beolgyonensis TaxID=864064 RepID=UPI003D658FF3
MMKWFFLIVLVTLSSCKAQKEIKPMGQEIDGLELIENQEIGPFLSFDTQVVRDVKSLRKIYTEINKTRKPGLPVPDVDFSKDMVVLVCLGEQKTQRKLLLSVLNESDDETVIAVESKEVKSAKTQLSGLTTYPFYLYKLPIIDTSVSFQSIQE